MFLSNFLKKNNIALFRQLKLLKIQSQTLNIKENKFESILTYCENDKYLDPAILYIITIKFSLTNSLIILSNTKGDPLYFYSAGSVNIKGKQKLSRIMVFNLLVKQLISNCPFIKNKPVVLHLFNTLSHKNYITTKISNLCLILFLKISDYFPHNGCRPSKKRRKKFRTKKKK